MEPKEDRRVRRTRQALQNALIELIVEKGYDKITVSDLIDRADVGRSTFYSHYETKDDLLATGMREYLFDILPPIEGGEPNGGALMPARMLFEHLDENHRMYARLIGGSGIEVVHQAMHNQLYARAMEIVGTGSRPYPTDVQAAYLAGSLLSLLEWWLDNGRPHPAAEMADMYERLTASAISGLDQ